MDSHLARRPAGPWLQQTVLLANRARFICSSRIFYDTQHQSFAANQAGFLGAAGGRGRIKTVQRCNALPRRLAAMELARDRNESSTRDSNCRCAGIGGARLESSRALAWNGRVPSRSARDAGVLKTAANRRARITHAACCGALQQACANRGGWRLVSYDVLRMSEADNPVRLTTLADTIVCVTSPRA